MKETPITLVSFDVDGTLIHSIGDKANYLHKAAFKHAWKAVFDLDTHIDVVAHHGSTDPLILLKVAQHHGIDKEEAMRRLPEAKAAMVEYFLDNVKHAPDGLEILPGVVDLLTALKDHGSAATCLVTGNLEPIGWSKMEALGLLPLFSSPPFGGFGSDFCSGNVEESWRDRADFVRIAAEKLEAAAPGRVGRRFHVGDTPMDVQAALAAGATPVAVATGIFSRQDLLDSAGGAEVIMLDDLTDTTAVMRALGLL